MALLGEPYTLCETPVQNASHSAIVGVEPRGDPDHVLVTDVSRSITVYKVCDQKPVGRWTLKQGQTINCPAVFNSQSQEYILVTDNRVLRLWKEDDVSIEKAFKATLSADVTRVLLAPDSEPVLLFACGSVRLLESVLAAPQQHIQELLSPDDVIRWSTILKAEQQLVVLFSTEQDGDLWLYVHTLNPNTLVKYRFVSEPGLSAPVSFSATCRAADIHLVYTYSSGHIYESVFPVKSAVSSDGAVRTLPRSLRLKLAPGGDDVSLSAAVVLDEAHVAVVGFSHPTAGTSKDCLCIWNTHFETLQTSKEISGRLYSQLWCYHGKLFVVHGKLLSVFPFECQKSSLAAALGKMKSSSKAESGSGTLISAWTDATPAARRTIAVDRKSSLNVDQLTRHIKTQELETVQTEVDAFVCRTSQTELQLCAGPVTSELVSRSQSDVHFYPHDAFLQLVESRFLCYSMCPELLSLALERKDFTLCQSIFRLFPDIPEAMTCAFLKTILSTCEEDLESSSLDGVALEKVEPEDSCPLGLHKAALLNDILQTAFSETDLMPHLKDLSVPQVTMFLQYLQFLYLKYCSAAHAQARPERTPSLGQIMDWMCLILNSHFTVLLMVPEAKHLLMDLHKFVRSQVKLYGELSRIEGSLRDLGSKGSEHCGLYSIDVIKFF